MSSNPQVNDDVHLPSITKSCNPVFGPEPPPSQDIQEILALTKNLAFACVKNEMEADGFSVINPMDADWLSVDPHLPVDGVDNSLASTVPTPVGNDAEPHIPVDVVKNSVASTAPATVGNDSISTVVDTTFDVAVSSVKRYYDSNGALTVPRRSTAGLQVLEHMGQESYEAFMMITKDSDDDSLVQQSYQDSD